MASIESALLNAAIDAIVVTDEHDRIDVFNSAAERMFGYCAAEVAGERLALLLREPPAVGTRSPGDGRCSAGGRPRGREVQARRSSGEVFPAWMSLGGVDEGGCRRSVAIFRDLSEQKAVASRMRALEARLSASNGGDLLDELGANIAHEINQPLSAIATYAQAARRIVLSGSSDTRTLADACERIDEQARRAGQVVQGIRRLIREPRLAAENLDVNAVVADLMRLIETDAGARGIAVTREVGEDLPRVRGDAIQLQTAIVSLVRNSIDAMHEVPPGSPLLRIGTAPGAGGAVRITVTDCGPGVPDALGERVFDPFVTTKHEHAGLGLSTSRAIVEAHGGTLGIERAPRAETRFVITLPACDEGAHA